jgi:RimJ/RimL family protein N-acetyltransferase
MNIPVHELSAKHIDLLKQHFDRLDNAAIHLRFGNTLSHEARCAYVDQISFQRDAVFGVFADDLTLLGVAHLACVNATGELGLSVLTPHQNCGIGSALLARAATHARNTQVSQLYVNCLAENGAMMHIARKAGMQIVTAHADADAYLALLPGTPFSIGQEYAEQELARLDWHFKAMAEGRRGNFVPPEFIRLNQ